MSGPYDLFKTDASLETAGVVIDYGPFWVRIARAGGANKRFAKALEAKLKPYRRALQTDTMDQGIAEKLLVESFSETVVLAWGTKDAAGALVAGPIPGKDGPLPFSAANVAVLLVDLPDLFADLREQANKVSIFRRDTAEADAGN